MLGEQGLTYLVRDNRLEITTRTASESYVVNYLYEVHDLLPRISDIGGETSLEDLNSLVMNLVAPETWRDAYYKGEQRSIRTPGTVALRFEQKQQVHREIETLFELLRESHVPELYDARRLRPWTRPATPASNGN